MVFPRLPFVESWRRARRRGRASGPEVVVVGAGLGGLVTAALLAERYQVAIVERNPFAGGYASAVRYGDTAFDFGAQDIAILGREGMRTIRRLGLLPRLRRIRPHAVSIYPLGARAIVANVDPRLVGAWLGVQDGVRLPTGGGPRADHLSRCQLLATLADDAPALPFVTFFASTYDKAQEYQGFVDGEPLSIRMFCPPVQPRTLSVALPAPYLPWRAAFDRGPEIYASAKEAMMGRVLALVLRAYPALAGKLQPIDLLTPVEVAARGGNSAGSLYGADAIPDQTGLPRSLLVPAVRGLFFAGQWAAPGGSATLVLRGAALTASATHTFLKGAT